MGIEHEDRIEACARLLLAAVREAGAWVSGDGRVTEDVAAKLLGWSPESLAKRRQTCTGPAHYRIGGVGYRISYRLRDLAEFIEAMRAE